MGDERPVVLSPKQRTLPRRHDHQATVTQPVEADGLKRSNLHANAGFPVPVTIEGENLLRTPVGNPQTAVVPARRLPKDEIGEQNLRSHRCVCCSACRSRRLCNTSQISATSVNSASPA